MRDMVSPWPRVPVHELQSAGTLLVEDGNHGENRPRPAEFSDAGCSFVRAADMDSGRVDFARASHITDVARARIRKGVGAPRDVLLSHKGTVGKVAYVPDPCPEFVCSPQTTFYRTLDETILSSRFLYYFLQSPDFVKQLRSRKGETDMADYVSLTEQRKLLIMVPPLPEQRRVAGVLGALDDLIETNRRLIGSLNALRRAVWAGGHGTARTFGEVACLRTERTTPYEVEPDSPYLGLEHFAVDGGGLTSVGLARDLDSQKTVFHAGDTLYGKLRPYFRKVARPDFGGICSTEIWVLRPAPGIDPEFLEHVVSTEDFTDHAMSGSGGTRMPRASWEHVSRMTIQVPDPDDMVRLSDLTRPMWGLSWALNSESQMISRTRDELLPLLLSGRVLVREVAA